MYRRGKLHPISEHDEEENPGGFIERRTGQCDFSPATQFAVVTKNVLTDNNLHTFGQTINGYTKSMRF